GQIAEELDDPADALAFYEQAARMQARLVAAAPDDEVRLAAQARTLSALGRSLQGAQRWDDADRSLADAEAVQRRLVEQHPEEPEFARGLADVVSHPGPLDAARGQSKSAVQRLSQAQAVRSKLQQTAPAMGQAGARLAADAARDDLELARMLLAEGDRAAARERAGQAQAQLAELLAKEPDSESLRSLRDEARRLLAELGGAP
ncbi:MAG TPA: hypothetical protein PJ982_08855, partial [Lacipirellulaceae bacterium]|nr:hypothetical protein [Lacipirellulaceae bacterium]